MDGYYRTGTQWWGDSCTVTLPEKGGLTKPWQPINAQMMAGHHGSFTTPLRGGVHRVTLITYFWIIYFGWKWCTNLAIFTVTGPNLGYSTPRCREGTG